MKRFLALVALAVSAFAQTAVNQVAGPPPSPYVDLFFYDGSGNLQYDCRAPQSAQTTSWTKAATTLTNIVVSSNTATVTTSAAHGLYPGAKVTIQGATVDLQLNATYIVLTVPLATTFTITTANVGDATYTDAGLIATTNWPLQTSAVWAIRAFTYSGTTLTGAYWAGSATTSARLKCSERTNY